MSRNSGNKEGLHLKNINGEIKRQFKAWCVRRGRTMTKVIEQMMKDKIKEK